MNVEQAVLERVLPSEEDETRLRAAVSSVFDILSKNIRRLGLKADPVLVGSVAVGAHTKNPDVDVFVQFPPETSRENLEKYGLQLGQFLKDKKRMYAEHPYTRGSYKGFEFEIVPCYKVVSPDQKMSAVDRTPHHAKYILGRIKPEQRDEVRLLKTFMKGVGVYGAEAKIQGFSGYLAVLLVLKYGSFRQTLEAVTRWQAGNVIALDMLPTRIFDEPLIVVDPVDGGRNVASAVSKEQMAVMIHAAMEYIKKPGIEFFFPPPPPKVSKTKMLSLLKERGTHLMVLAMRAPKVVDDVLFPQVRKALKSFEEMFARHGFFLMNSDFDVMRDSVIFMFEFETFELPRMKKHGGPPAWVKNATDFVNKWRGARETFGPPYIEDGQWFVNVRRGPLTAGQLVTAKLKELSLGKDLDSSARRSLRVHVDEKAFKPSYMYPLRNMMERSFPWER